ncbi:MAG: FAD-binding protein, partial [Planctomycetes bacterium]|nr:FAD-binding protein [Planctomycetota bacterium]
MAATQHIRCDLLVIGCGIAGAAAAIKAADAGLHVVVTTKEDELLETNTRWAQGGIIGTGPDDTADLLYADVMRAGAELNNPHAVRIFCEEGPRQVDTFLVNRLKVPFSRDKRGRILHTAEAAHSRRRIYFKEDRTGYAIHVACIKAMKAHRRIRLLPGHMAVDITTLPHHSTDPLDIYQPLRAVGAYVLELRTGRVLTVLAPKTVLATGGMGHIYLHSTNPTGATGDGFAMAYRAGARCINMEYVQFHPTTLHHVSAPGFLITEAVRGEGAKLRNLRGEYFMARYDSRADLAPRDIVARSIYAEISAHKESYVLL